MYAINLSEWKLLAGEKGAKVTAQTLLLKGYFLQLFQCFTLHQNSENHIYSSLRNISACVRKDHPNTGGTINNLNKLIFRLQHRIYRAHSYQTRICCLQMMP